MRKRREESFRRTDEYDGRNKIDEDGQQLCSKQCGQHKVWVGLGHICQTPTLDRIGKTLGPRNIEIEGWVTECRWQK